MKNPVILLFGGQSGEHEVSIMSARSIYKGLKDNNAMTYLIAISKSGKFLKVNEQELEQMDSFNEGLTDVENPLKQLLDLVVEIKSSNQIPVVFPIIHGTYGEDGKLQGLLEMLNLPYVGCTTIPSALTIDKEFTRIIAQANNVLIPKYFILHKHEHKTFAPETLKLEFPLFVKPANLGSSVGISKVKDITELDAALKLAFDFDLKVIIEEGVDVLKELEVAVLGNNEFLISPPGELIVKSEFYDYETKYQNVENVIMQIPAEVEQNIVDEARDKSEILSKALNLKGLSRIDFLLSKDKKLYFNEANSMPGFTQFSMYPKLMEHIGINFAQLVMRLIELALENYKENQDLKRDFSSNK